MISKVILVSILFTSLLRSQDLWQDRVTITAQPTGVCQEVAFSEAWRFRDDPGYAGNLVYRRSTSSDGAYYVANDAGFDKISLNRFRLVNGSSLKFVPVAAQEWVRAAPVTLYQHRVQASFDWEERREEPYVEYNQKRYSRRGKYWMLSARILYPSTNDRFLAAQSFTGTLPTVIVDTPSEPEGIAYVEVFDTASGNSLAVVEARFADGLIKGPDLLQERVGSQMEHL